ncbi:alkaline phosphatase D family protein, partial [Wenyingzhuangia sp. 1_MG-2023]|nr:alkaline phosphatase D family protein [Wenyingzhuangia sp. 1_MG-2023]
LALATMLETYATAKYMQSLGMDIDDDVATALATTAPYNLDAWDGYEVARQTLYAQISGQSRDVNLVTLAGDTHNAWASQLTLSG